MKTQLRKCPSCGTYTLKEKCVKCDSPTVMPIQARYSPEDRFGKYRRMTRETKG